MLHRAVITGIGLVTPLGNSPSTFFNNALKGENRIRRITKFDTSNFAVKIGAELNFEPGEADFTEQQEREMTPAAKWAVIASRNAVADAGVDVRQCNPYDIDVVVGVSISALEHIQQEQVDKHWLGMSNAPVSSLALMNPAAAAVQICQDLGIHGEALNITTACSSSTTALGYAARQIQHGESSCVLAGGADEGVSPIFIGTLAPILSRQNDYPDQASRPFERNRDGHVLSDAACIFVVESYERAKARGANIYCEITGYCGTSDGSSAFKLSKSDEHGAASMERAICRAKRRPEDINYYCALGIGEKFLDVRETRSIKRVFAENARKLPISSIKSMMGHPLGAAGAVQAATCALAIKHGAIPPTINYDEPDPECDLDYVPNQAREARIKNAMLYTLGNGGSNTSLVLSEC